MKAPYTSRLGTSTGKNGQDPCAQSRGNNEKAARESPDHHPELSLLGNNRTTPEDFHQGSDMIRGYVTLERWVWWGEKSWWAERDVRQGRAEAASNTETSKEKANQASSDWSAVSLYLPWPQVSYLALNAQKALQHSSHAFSCLLTTYFKIEALSEKMPSLWVPRDSSQKLIKVLNTQCLMHSSNSIQLSTKKSVVCQMWDKPWQPRQPEQQTDFWGIIQKRRS